MPSIRNLVKAGAEFVLLHGGPAAMARASRPLHRVILAYHNVLPPGVAPCGERSLHITSEDFREQLQALANSHEVIALDELLASEGNSSSQAAITFDDAYGGAVTAGLDVLEDLGLPATIFVAPGLLGGPACWWDALSESTGGVIPKEVRQHAIDGLAGCDMAIRAWASKSIASADGIPVYARPASLEQLSKAATCRNVLLGAHSWSHRNLARLSPSDLEEELERPLAWLRSRFSNVLPILSYPYGMASSEVALAAKAAGYEGALQVQGGPIPPGTLDMFALSRMNVPAGLSVRGFRLRTSGLLACG